MSARIKNVIDSIIQPMGIHGNLSIAFGSLRFLERIFYKMVNSDFSACGVLAGPYFIILSNETTRFNMTYVSISPKFWSYG